MFKGLMRAVNTPILEWWQVLSKQLPVLSRVARWLLAVQAMSASSKQDFNAARQLVSKLRASLNPKTTRVFTFLHANDNLLAAILERKKKASM